MALSRKTKGLIIAALALACIGGGIWGWKLYEGRKPHGLVLYGNVDIRQVDLGFRVGGRIESVLVDEGDAVAEGQPLARLDADMLRQQRDQAAARLAGQKADLARLERGYRTEEVAQARAQVAAARAVAENAAINLHRVISMRQSNAISQKELDNARAADREAAARLRSSQDQLDMLLSGYREEEVLAQRAAVAAAEAELRRADIELADGVLHAPQKGVILTRAREAGAIVQPGQTVYTLTLTDPVWLRAYVDEPNLGKIKPGMAVRVAVDAAPGKTFPGTVGFISPTAEFTPKTVETREVRTALVYRLRVQAEDPENVMRQGMPVTIFVDAPAP
ncbi:MAG: secretion protein HlyD [Desulfovibrio sp.]|nr:secretion protein HlyD [Desulfovibrio sp.]